MRPFGPGQCESCNLKCDLFLTAREMGKEPDLQPHLIRYRKHDKICNQGNPISHAIILLEGNAKMYVDGINGKNIIISILLPSNYIGLMAVFGSMVYKYNVASLTECLTCQVDMETVKGMYHSNASFMEKLNRQIGESVSLIMSKLVSLNQKQVRGKVAESLLYLSQLYESDRFFLTVTRRELGELSAISEENTVKVLAEFRNEGIIEMKGKEIEIKETGILRKISAVG